MRNNMRPCCHTFLAFILKFLNFLETFVGLSIIIYSVYMLHHWHNHAVYPPPSSSAPSSDFPNAVLSNFDAVAVSDLIPHLNFADDVVSHLQLNSQRLPAPWFIYAFMGMGVVVCCVTCIGHIAAEAINGCCLCFYALLTTVLFLLEAALVAFIALDHHWEKDLPVDPTGELDSLRTFIEENVDVCKWVGISVIIMQSLSLLLALILRAMVSTSIEDHDTEGDYDVSTRTQEPLLNTHLSQSFGSMKGNGKGVHSDVWSSRMREKYGLKNDEAKYNS